MKEDYLWDKTGEDAEIQALENALMAFRYEETAPPELPQKVFTVEKAEPRRFFQRFGFAFAAFAAVAVIFCAVWFQIADNKIPVIETVAETTAPKNEDQVTDGQIIKTPDDVIAPVKIVQTTAPRVAAKIRRNAVPVVRPNKAVLRNIKVKEPAETLTAEEKYAYDQLMLALSITGSKLKIVKDKIDGIEEQNAVLDTVK
jgi:hypothetical protein